MKKPLGSLLAALALAILPAVAQSQEFPSKPIKYVVPYPPGGSGDFLGRLFASYLSQALGQNVVVENKPGASTNIGLEQVARAEPDGYTLMQAVGVTMMNVVFGPKPAVDPFADLVPVAAIAEMAMVIAANPGAGIGSAQDMVSLSKTKRLTIGHAQFEPQIKLLTLATGATVDSIPYKGGAPSVLAAMAGEVSLVATYVPVVVGHVNSGKLRAVGVTSSSRVAALPEVRTFAEQGFPRFTTTVWYAILAPKGTPDAVVRKLTGVMNAAVKNPEFVERLRTGGAEPMWGGPDAVTRLMRDELKLWSEVAGAK